MMSKPLAYGSLGAAYGMGRLKKYFDKNPNMKDAAKSATDDGKKVFQHGAKKAVKFVANPSNMA